MNFDTFGTLLAFAYFGGNDILGSSTLGVWNSIEVAGTILNTIFGLASLYIVAKDHKGFNDYLTNESDEVKALAAKTIGLKAVGYNFETIQGKVYIAGITSKPEHVDEIIKVVKNIKGVKEIVNYVIIKE